MGKGLTAEAGDLAIAIVPAKEATACCCWWVRCAMKGMNGIISIIAMKTNNQEKREMPIVIPATCITPNSSCRGQPSRGYLQHALIAAELPGAVSS